MLILRRVATFHCEGEERGICTVFQDNFFFHFVVKYFIDF
jgi:hypothetical protein